MTTIKTNGRRRYEGYKFSHSVEPDYVRPLRKVPDDIYKSIMHKLSLLYGDMGAKECIHELERICKVYYTFKPNEMIKLEERFDPKERFTEEDVILITYGDLIREFGVPPLITLSKFCGIYLQRAINTLHILPFFPYSSDRGFSVIDFKSVDPTLGTWENIEDLEYRYKLMFDGVINHVSSQSYWFQEFLNDCRYFKDFFISFNSYEELTPEERGVILRPRTSDILTGFNTINGRAYVWSTFSKDQVDLNYRNPNVLMKVIEILLLYVRRGADIVRLDAVTYLWTNPGTSCANQEETHVIVKLFRQILDVFAPHVAIITESNIPHHENITYFGNGKDEAQMVYNFALPPLVLHTFYSNDSTKLTEWATSLRTPSEFTTFFNFLDSHDGIGLMPVKDILLSEDVDFMIGKAEEHGGYISYKIDKDGNEVPYEINITWFSALNRDKADESLNLQIKRFIASRSIALVLQGVPGIYIHSFFGTKNDKNAVIDALSRRDINRTIINYNTLIKELNSPHTLTSKISRRLKDLIAIRIRIDAFHPNAMQYIINVAPEVFVVHRVSVDKKQHVLCIINISDKNVSVEIPMEKVYIHKNVWYDLIWKKLYSFKSRIMNLKMQPYDFVWLVPE